MTRNRYGMRFRTIKYFQDQGYDLLQRIGYDAAVDAYASALQLELAGDAYHGQARKEHMQRIAHRAIGMAAVDPIRVKMLLSTGKATF